MASLGLCVISESYDKNVRRIIKDYGQFFDEIYIQINGGGVLPQNKPHVHFSSFQWVSDFSKARNALLSKVNTDYWMWLDSDDSILNPERIKILLKQMEDEGFGMIILPYNYDIAPNGDVITLFWRERIFKLSEQFKWINPVHELLDRDQALPEIKALRTDAVQIQHAYRTAEDNQRSSRRNLKILKRIKLNSENRPTITYYLANCYGVLNKIPESVKQYEKAIKFKGVDELVYDSLIRLGVTYFHLNQPVKANNMLRKAIKLRPEWPDGYVILGTSIIIFKPQNAKEGIRLIEESFKKEARYSLLPLNPQVTSYRPYYTLAAAYFNLGDHKKARDYAHKVRQFNIQDETVNNSLWVIESTYEAKENVKKVLRKISVVKDKEGLRKLLNSQPDIVLHDQKLKPALLKAFEAKIWPVNSIVFVCYRSIEPWGPDTLHKGIGGSEEAVIYLTAALAKLGWDVSVFSPRTNSTTYKNVKWLPLEKLRIIDKFNIFVAWRDLSLVNALNVAAKLKAVDFHDIPDAGWPLGLYEPVDLVFFKSHYHRALVPNLPPRKAVVISNGIEPHHFKNPGIDRNPFKVIYASAPDRGLDLLMELWPEVKKAVPKAELVWAYGWDNFDAANLNISAKQVWRKRTEQMISDLGVKVLGRLDHPKLAREMMSCGVWAYPTYFSEINCITALKAQAAGVEPITSGFSALQETVFSKYEANIADISVNNTEKRIFTERLIRALNNPLTKTERSLMSKQALDIYSWDFIASKWDKVLKENLRYN